MFSRNQTKSNLSGINANPKENDISSEEIFNLLENKNGDKITEYINNPNYKIWKIRDENNNTILHKTCFLDYIELSTIIIQELKKRFGSSSLLSNFINEKNDGGLTALHYTAFKGNLELSKILIKNGASVDAITNLGKNIIHLSSEGNQPSLMIYFLIKEKLDIYTRDENGSSPLHWACFSGAKDSIKFLIGLNADIDAQDKEKLTPLHLAAFYNREEIIIQLLQNGADKNAKTTRGELPIDIARKKNYKSIINILEDKDYNPLCSLKTPLEYINPTDVYKKYILIMIILPEISIIFMILPYLDNITNIILNNVLFLIELALILFLFFVEPGYKKNDILINDNYSGNINYNNYPLMNLIENNIDIRNYCPKCFIQESNNIKHCIICDKCIEDFSHHCFWINKCIGKKNKLLYLFFILFSFIFNFHSMFICTYTLFDSVFIPYEKLIYKSVFSIGEDRELRVLLTAIVVIFNFIISFPLAFLLFIELMKFCRKKSYDNIMARKLNNTDIGEAFEMQVKSQGKKRNSILIENSINHEIDNNDLLGLNRETNIINNNNSNSNSNNNNININNENEILLSANSKVPIPQTPFSIEKKLLNENSDD